MNEKDKNQDPLKADEEIHKDSPERRSGNSSDNNRSQFSGFNVEFMGQTPMWLTGKFWRWIGAIALGLLLFAGWYFGFLIYLLYIAGIYGSLYILSLVFGKKFVNTILNLGSVIVTGLLIIGGLWLFYLVLQVMFEQSFILGILLLLFGLPIAEAMLYGIIMLLALPLFFLRREL